MECGKGWVARTIAPQIPRWWLCRSGRPRIRPGKVQDKGGWSLKRHPPLNPAPQSGSGRFIRWLYFNIFAVQGGRSKRKTREKPSVAGFSRVAVIGGFQGL